VRFDNILVAVDLTAASANTLKVASELGQIADARLVLAHVLDPALMLPASAQQDMKETIDLWMKPYAKKATRFAVEVVEGSLVDELTRLATKYDADLLVIGTHPAGTLSRLVFGSRADVLFRHVGIPVLTVGSHVHGSGERFSSILLPTDLEPHSFRAAQYAVALAEEFNAKLTLLHLPIKHDLGSAEAAMERMQQLVPEDAALWCQPEFRTVTGDPMEAIMATAANVEADLIVLGVTHYRPLADHASWSIASRVVHQAACPVLTVRDHL
jgi:nucleotide-binding universal stress UspA family protein